MSTKITANELMLQTTEYTPEQREALMKMRNALSSTALARIATYGSPRTIAAATALVSAERDSKDAGRRIGQAVYILRETGNWRTFTDNGGKTYKSFTKFVESELPDDWDARNLINYGDVFGKFGESTLIDRYGMGLLKDLKAVFGNKEVKLEAVEADIAELEMLDNSGRTLTQKQIREYAATIKAQPDIAGKYVANREEMKKKNAEREKLEAERKKQEAEREKRESEKRVTAENAKKEKEKEKEKKEEKKEEKEREKFELKTPAQVQRERVLTVGQLILEKMAILQATRQEGIVFQFENNTYALFIQDTENTENTDENTENTDENTENSAAAIMERVEKRKQERKKKDEKLTEMYVNPANENN